jgi:ABC-2 type transport system ATP-binding protein
VAAAAVDEEALTAQVPSDGGIGSLRSVLDRLDAAGIPLTDLSVHTPDLDDVFLALTGDRR